VAGASQIKQEGTIVCLELALATTSCVLPVLTGVATNAITIFDLKQGDCSSLVLAAIMKIFVIPAMKMPAVKKS
jgi:hypothetical protein